MAIDWFRSRPSNVTIISWLANASRLMCFEHRGNRPGAAVYELELRAVRLLLWRKDLRKYAPAKLSAARAASLLIDS